MKRSVKIILLIAFILTLAGTYFAYQIYKISKGVESLSGTQESVPEPIALTPEITYGNADWLNWRGYNYEGKSRFFGLNTNWSKGLEQLWELHYLCQDDATASWSSPVVQGNRLVIPGRNNTSDLLFCLHAETGQLIWLSSYEAETSSSHGPGPRATPCIDNNKVYTLGRSGDLVCWQLEDGQQLWHKNVKKEGGEEPRWGYSSSPIILGDKVIVQGGGSALVLAYDKNSGELIWKSMEGEAGYAAAMTIVLDQETALLIYHASGLSCLNAETGKLYWTAPWETNYGVNATTPVVSGDVVFHTSAYGMGCQALKVSKAGYQVLWKSNVFEAQHSDPVLIDGFLYGYSGDSSRKNGQFKCVELVSGKELWTTSEIGQGTTLYVDGHLICLDIQGNLHLLNPNPAGFEKLGTLKTALKHVKHPAWTIPVVANGKIYLRYMQQLVCYKLD